ncbi:hypothetical protein SAMN05216464_12626 [Mucilaginibacter pineti]|uniref:Uncharacterized protein n=1 Tax=Mucilaginibacter pineti TaxID=1391627 RepID=A0A1G7NDP1_9SPHI|nr:DUF6804 family protein [Mucilaginibacter pineti]SDF72154.1 hypothetical protein SAMN05216464_12626 [Mucilaginibacter pineti]
MIIHPEDSQKIRLVVAFPLLITSLQTILNDVYANYIILNIAVFLLSIISTFNSINKSVAFDKRGINITDSYYLVDNAGYLTVLYAIVAILYNPFHHFRFQYETWAIIGLTASLLFSLPYLIQKAKEKEIEGK